MSHNRMRSFNKHILNRLTRTFASFSRGPFAVVRHVVAGVESRMSRQEMVL